MRPIFTIHAGEYIVASFIEKKFKGYNVWVPSRDRGIDLLITNSTNKKTVSIQVKSSKDWLSTSQDWAARVAQTFQQGLKSCGWWALKRDKISNSPADFWVFLLYGINLESVQYVIIKPEELLKKLILINGNIKTIQTYLWVTAENKCWETRGLKRKDQILVATHIYSNKNRNFTDYLNNWKAIKIALK